MRRAILRLALAAAFTAAAILPVRAWQAAPPAGWPQWLGPSRNGAVEAPGALSRPGLRLAEAWRRPLGFGVAAVVVSEGRAFTTATDGESDVAVAYSATDGREVWRVTLDPARPDDERGPASTPAVAGTRLFVLSPACQLRALDVATGRILWQRDLKADFAVKLGQGCATSPLVEGETLLVQAGGRENDQRLVALAPDTGQTVWTARGTERTLYSSPVVTEIGGVRQVILHHTIVGPPPRSALMGVSLTDRSVLWSRPLERNLSFDTPLVLPDGRVALLTWNDAHVMKVVSREGRFEAEPVWRSEDLTAYVSPPVYHQGHLYGFGGDFLACLDAATGRVAWKQRLYAGSVTLVDGHLLVQSVNAGILRVVEATAAGYREKAQIQVFNRGSRAEAPPSFAAGRVFVRNDEEVVAVNVGG